MLYGLSSDSSFGDGYGLDILMEDAVSDAKRQKIINLCWKDLRRKLLMGLIDISNLNFDNVLYPVNGKEYKAYKFRIGRLNYAFVDENAYKDDYAFDDDQDCICFFILDDNGNSLDSLDLQRVLSNGDKIKHELTHWLDSFRIAPMRSNDPNRTTPQGKEYYRSPIESNAFTSMLENLCENNLKRIYEDTDFSLRDYIEEILFYLDTLRQKHACKLTSDSNLINYVFSLTEGQYKRLKTRLISYINFTYYRLTNNLKAIDYKKYNEDPLLGKRK